MMQERPVREACQEILILVRPDFRATVINDLGLRLQPRLFEEWIGFRRAIPASSCAVLLVDPTLLRPRAFEDLLDQVSTQSQATILVHDWL